MKWGSNGRNKPPGNRRIVWRNPNPDIVDNPEVGPTDGRPRAKFQESGVSFPLPASGPRIPSKGKLTPSIVHQTGSSRSFLFGDVQELDGCKRVYQDRSGAACLGAFQTVHSVSRFLSLSNNLGNLLFARRTTPMAVSDRVLIRF